METFHEDVTGTILFCFLACLGALILAVQAKGWHGLCPYGGRLRRNRSHALAATLFFLAYSLYFSDPQHRNVRNIEGFMSLVSLVVGGALAAVFLALWASLAEELRRWLLRRKVLGKRALGYRNLVALKVEGAGEVLFTEGFSGGQDDLLAFMEPSPASRGLAEMLAAHLPGDKGLAFILPVPPKRGERAMKRVGENGSPQERVKRLLDALEESRAEKARGCRVLVVGNASRLFLSPGLDPSGLLERWSPERVLMLAPPLPARDGSPGTDSLVSNTPLDLLRALPGEGGIPGHRMGAFLKAWSIAFLLMLPIALFLPLAFKARWWFLSGPTGAAVASFWVSFHLKGPGCASQGNNLNKAEKTSAPPAPATGADGTPFRCIVVVSSDDLGSLDSEGPGLIEMWGDVGSVEVVREPLLLRGKLLSWPSLPSKLEEWIWG